MEERNIDNAEEAVESVTTSQATQDTDTPLDKNIRLMSPTQMVLRRFFRSKLSIIGLIMVIGLFLFSFLGPVFYTQWGETQPDATGKINYTQTTVTYTDADGNEYSIKQCQEHIVTHDEGNISAVHSVQGDVTDTGKVKHLLGDNSTRKQTGKKSREGSNDGDKSVSECVLVYNFGFGKALCTCGAYVVGVKDLEHIRSCHSHSSAYTQNYDGKYGYEHMHKVVRQQGKTCGRATGVNQS